IWMSSEIYEQLAFIAQQTERMELLKNGRLDLVQDLRVHDIHCTVHQREQIELRKVVIEKLSRICVLTELIARDGELVGQHKKAILMSSKTYPPTTSSLNEDGTTHNNNKKNLSCYFNVVGKVFCFLKRACGIM